MPQSREERAEYMRRYRAGKEAAKAARKSRAESGSRHRDAVTRLLDITGLDHVPEEAPLVALVIDLAEQLDEGASGSVRSQYRNALRDVRQVLNATVRAAPKASPDVPAPTKSEPATDVPEVDEPTSLAKFKEERGIG